MDINSKVVTVVKQDDLNIWLTAEDVKTGDEIEFIDEGKYAEIQVQDGTKRVFNITVKLKNKETRVWTPNTTSRRTISRTLGDDTKAWIGEKWPLVIRDQMVGNSMKKVIYAAEDRK